MKMQRQFPDEYNFFPKTWLLPSELTDFKNQFLSYSYPTTTNAKNSTKPVATVPSYKKQKKKTFIVKPEGLS